MGGRAIRLVDYTHKLARRSNAAAPAVLIGAAAMALLGGCGMQTVAPGADSADAPAAALPLRVVYEAEGDGRAVLFVDVAGATQEELDQIITDLSAELDADILPGGAAFRSDPDLPALTPIDPDTGLIGVSLTLDRMAPVSPNRYEATVKYARSGLDGGFLTVVLERAADEWMVIQQIRGPQA
ncbi:MAG: hypothetical protein ACYSUI_06740 [Planctomycetota bacterium]